MINQVLIKTLHHNLFPKGFRVFGEQKDMAFPYYTRFFKSMEDFSFFKPPTNETELNAVNVTSAGGDELEEAELETCESKNKAGGSDVLQLIANMNKVAGRLAAIVVGGHTLFWKIHVYGLLCDYSNMTVTEVLKLELDFKNKRSILYNMLIIGPSGLTIEEAIIRIVSKIEGGH